MKAYELMELVVKEPEKYNKKTFAVTSGSVLNYFGQKLDKFELKTEKDSSGSVNVCDVNGDRLYFSIKTELVEELKEVPFMEAVKIHRDNHKTIRCDRPGEITIYKYTGPFSAMWDHLNMVTIAEILDGKWYVEE